MKEQKTSSQSLGRLITELLSKLRTFHLILAAAALLFGAFFALFDLEAGLEQTAVSHHVLASADSFEEERLVVVMCTDNTIEQIAADTGWPIDRSYYTQLLQGPLADAKTVVFDILFADKSDEATDTAFAQAISDHGGVVLARSESTLPMESLFYSGARIGYAIEFNESDQDAVSRRYKLFVNSDLRTGPTLICSALLSQGYAIEYSDADFYTVTSPEGSSVRINVDRDGYFYRVPLQHGIDVQVIDLYDVYTGNYDAGTFDNAVVFVGGTVAGFEDIVYAPDFSVGADYSDGSAAMRVVGTKYLADCYSTVLRGFGPASTSKVVEGVICALIFLLSAFLSMRLSIRLNWLVPVAAGFGWFGLSRLLFTQGICCLPTVSPILCACFAYLLTLVIRLVRTSRERMVSSLPIETLYNMAYKLDTAETGSSFEDYMHSFGDEVFQQLGVSVIHARTTRPDVPSSAWDGSRSGAAVLRGRSVAAQYGVRTLMIIPLPSFEDEDPSYTVLGSDRRAPSHWVQSVTALVLAMYVYYEAQQQSSEKQRMAMSMVSVIIQMIDAKDPVTAGHSRRVAGYSRQIAQWLGFDRRRVADVEFAALLHDIGKIGVADAVLNKPGLFTDSDFAQMRSHPGLGAEIVRTMGLSEDIVDGVLHHHERMDGRGYPDGASGGEFARIIKVADVYDALTSQRQYKSAWDTSRALDVISGGIGTEFDERIARTFITNTAPEDYEAGKSASAKAHDRSSIDRLVKFSSGLWELSCKSVTENHSAIPAIVDLFELQCAHRFAGLEWGERFSSPAVLALTPYILHYSRDNGSVICALSGHSEDILHSAVFYFHKGCLSAGLAAVENSTSGSFEAELTKLHGSPDKHGSSRIWNAGKYRVIQLPGESMCAFVFITNYLSNEIQY